MTAASAARDVRIVHLPRGHVPLGALAGTNTVHPFVPDGSTGTSCMICFGWSSDFRHLGKAALAGAECS